MSFVPPYSLRVSEVYTQLETSPRGLASREVAARLALYGPNQPPQLAGDPGWSKLLRFVRQPMTVLLLSAGGAAAVLDRLSLAVVIWLVVALNTAVSIWQERRTERSILALQDVLPEMARVVREGEKASVPAREIVPGDLLLLAEGDNVPADARVVEEYGLRTNHATLSGDAVPARRTAEASLSESLTELERPNLVFAGTSVVSGTGRAVVYGTGQLTQFGRIAQLTQTVKEHPSLLLQEMSRLTRVITWLGVAAGAVALLVGRLDLELPWPDAVMLAIGIIVAIIPEGLLPTVTLSLAMAVQRLARQGVLVKKLAVIETLGKVSVILTDKSGTLTQNQMTVTELWVGGHALHVSGSGYDPQGEIAPVRELAAVGSDLGALLTAAELCNNAHLVAPSTEHPGWSCIGDQTEAALRVVALKGGVDSGQALASYPRIHEVPFDARRKRMSTIHRNGRGQVAFVKGAPSEVLARCTHALMRGEIRPLDEGTRAEILRANDGYARRALRVLALARRELPPRGGAQAAEQIECELTFLGLAAMMDPPRPEVSQAMSIFRQAGIRLVMVTGDYGLTAESLARRVGLLSTPRPRIITGAELEAMDDEELQTALAQEVILARMAPEHKLRVVAAFQARGQVVAVIGDGVNDAPALRKADVGVTMGVAGSDVAKEAADIILANDDLGRLPSAIAEGRAVYDNIRRFVTYILASNVPEVLPFVLTALFRLPLALTVAQILAIDLGTDLAPALALGVEAPHAEVMDRPPRRRQQPLVSRPVLARALWLGCIEVALCYVGFAVAYRFGGTSLTAVTPGSPLAVNVLAMTVFHAGVVAAQVGNVFACRQQPTGGRRPSWLGNPLLWLGIAIELALIAALIYVRPLARVFGHTRLPAVYWAGLLAYPVILVGVDRLGALVSGLYSRTRKLGSGELRV